MYTGIVIENFYQRMVAYLDSSFLKFYVKTYHINSGKIQTTYVERFKKNYPDSLVFRCKLEIWTDTSDIQKEFDVNGNLVGLNESWFNDSIHTRKQYFFSEKNYPVLYKQESKLWGYRDGVYIELIGTEPPHVHLKIKYKNHKLVFIENDVCAFFNKKGRLISKEKFLKITSKDNNHIYWEYHSCDYTEKPHVIFGIKDNHKHRRRYRAIIKACC